MSINKRSKLFRLVALILVITLISPITAHAVEPRASNYLDSYNAYVYPAGGGKVQVYFSVIADNDMDDLGALNIAIYECTTNSSDINDWTLVKAVNNNTVTSLMGHDDYYHSGHVDYNGVAGRYYKAYVGIWAGKDGAGDARYFWTSAKKAT